MNLEDWRALSDFWIGEGKDPKHLNIPADMAQQLELPISMEETMTTETTEEGTEPRVDRPPFKKKKYFPADKCGYVGCNRKADGYTTGTKPTGKEDLNRLWFGPVCKKCTEKRHPDCTPITLAELAFERTGASDLALILDVEVGEVLKRLELAGVDEKGVAVLNTQPPADVAQVTEPVRTVETALGEEPVWPEDPPATEVVTPEGSVALTIAAVNIPADELMVDCADADTRQAFVVPYDIVDQPGMDWAAAQLAHVKGMWKRLEAARLALGAPMRDRLKDIQAYYTPVLGRFAGLEALLKTKITEGTARIAAMQAQALQQAQAAYQAGNPAAMAAATQAAVAADVVMPETITTRGIWKWRMVNATLVPLEMYDISPAKIDAAVAAGHRVIPGLEIYEEPRIASKAS